MNNIIAQKRDPSAKAKQLRRFGIVPGVIYGSELKESLAIQLDQSVARQLKRTNRNGSKLSIQVDGIAYPVLIKELEYSSLNNEIVHISFQVLDQHKKYNSIADIMLLNRDKVMGNLEQMIMQVPHSATPEHLLDIVNVDLDNMPIGTTITIGDIPEFCSNDIELQCDISNVVLRIKDKKQPISRVSE